MPQRTTHTGLSANKRGNNRPRSRANAYARVEQDLHVHPTQTAADQGAKQWAVGDTEHQFDLVWGHRLYPEAIQLGLLTRTLELLADEHAGSA